MNSYIKKIICEEEFEKVWKEIFSEDEIILIQEKNIHSNIKYDADVMFKSLCHTSLLMWTFHVFAHFQNDKCDSIFIATWRISEKFNKKIFEEYIWYSKNKKSGTKLFKYAIDYAKELGCELFTTNIICNNEKSEKIKTFYEKMGFSKDHEVFLKKL
jgi:hypothetical protein